MKVLIVWGSKMGGTEEIARILGESLASAGFDVTCAPAIAAPPLGDFAAVLVGGALYANRWHPEAHAFVTRNLAGLRRRPVWMFSSGPLDASAADGELPPPGQVATLMDRVGALGHVTFGGRLSPEHATSGMAAAMAKRQSGDWRDPARIRAWAGELVRLLPSAQPRPATEPPARGLPRLLAYGVMGAGLYALLASVLPHTAVALLRAAAVALIFTPTALLYFRPGRTRDPFPTAIAFFSITIALGLGVAALGVGGASPSVMLREAMGFWLPCLLVFAITWAVGAIKFSIPTRRAPGAAAASRAPGAASAPHPARS
jgi:menaquinone-dependent protoporphyrinogen oxidase